MTHNVDSVGLGLSLFIAKTMMALFLLWLEMWANLRASHVWMQVRKALCVWWWRQRGGGSSMTQIDLAVGGASVSYHPGIEGRGEGGRRGLDSLVQSGVQKCAGAGDG